MSSAAEDEEVHEAAAASLARLTEPDLSAFPSDTVTFAMARAFGPTGPDPAWLERLAGRVAELSDGAVRMSEAPREDFPYVVKDPSAAYARLDGPGGEQLLVIGPFTPPFQFVPAPTSKGDR
ncbi:MAG: hypothetical protein QOJ07_1537 [Thermoleophilaceae bacterium]|nr:hypothetical protein [Thermoleophilaceae bacterium]